MKIEIANVSGSNNRLVFKLDYPKALRRYFLKDTFFFEYGSSIDINNIDESILTIPIVSMIIPIAWAVGADIWVDKLDETYLHSLTKIEGVFKNFYPQFSFSTNIHVRNAVSNKFGRVRTGLLFSGGLDSVTSYVRHKDERPDLISVWGADIPLYERNFWDKAKAGILSFANIDGVTALQVKTNVRHINEQLLTKEFKVGGWYPEVSHGLMLLGLSAPITAVRQIGTVLIAASHTEEFKEPYGSDPRIDNQVSWADVGAVHDGYELTRAEKLEYLSRKYQEYLKYLRPCYLSARNYNCGRCEKCLRTIAALTLAGIDPQNCSFNINGKTFRYMKDCFVKGRFALCATGIFHWKAIQRKIPEQIDTAKYNSKEFFTWFKNYDLSKHKADKLQCFLWTIYLYFRNKNIKSPFMSIKRYFYIALARKLRILKF